MDHAIRITGVSISDHIPETTSETEESKTFLDYILRCVQDCLQDAELPPFCASEIKLFLSSKLPFVENIIKKNQENLGIIFKKESDEISCLSAAIQEVASDVDHTPNLILLVSQDSRTGCTQFFVISLGVPNVSNDYYCLINIQNQNAIEVFSKQNGSICRLVVTDDASLRTFMNFLLKKLENKNIIRGSATNENTTNELYVNQVNIEDTRPNLPLYSIRHESNERLLSSTQERFWFLEKFDEGELCQYNIPILFELKSGIDVELVLNGIREIVRRHEILRSCIEEFDGKPMGVVQNLERFPGIVEEIVQNESGLDSFLARVDFERFNLTLEVPIRVFLIRVLSSGKSFLNVIVHHIAFDGWSVGIFVKQLINFYQSRKPLVRKPLQYSDYARWEKNQLQNGSLNPSSKFWLNQLKNIDTLNVRTDFQRPNIFNHAGDQICMNIGKQLREKLQLVAKKAQTSLFTVLLSGYYLALRCWGRQDRIVVGTPVANRDEPQTQNMIGPFINTLVLGVDVDVELSLFEFIRIVSKVKEEALEHQSFPFDKLVELLSLPKDTSRNPVFQTMFTLDSFSADDNCEKYKSEHLMYFDHKSPHRISLFDFSAYVEEMKEDLSITLVYATSLFARDTMERFAKCFLHILYQFDSSLNLKTINYLEKDDQMRLNSSYERNWVKRETEGQSLQELFEKRVDEVPDQVALVSQTVTLTYKELNHRGNMIANYIRSKLTTVSQSKFIGLCLDKRAEMIIGILGIIKVGMAYVPMDPNDPPEKIKYILNDAKIECVLGEHKYEGLFESVEFVSLDNWESFHGISTVNPHIISTFDDLAYVIYTSGTTGYPKGCLVHHGAITNFIQTAAEFYFSSQQPANEVILFLFNYIFDASVEQVWLPLLYGQTLLVPSHNLVFEDNFLEYLQLHGVTHLHGSPTFISQKNYGSVTSLRRIILGGEAVNGGVFEKINGPYDILNAYGPTETCITSSLSRISNSDVFIGAPLPSVSYYLVSPELVAVPDGAVGELCIGGLGVCKGYLNLPELTKSKFIANPFRSEKEVERGVNLIIYRSGDLMRKRIDGNYDFLGRCDSQVKIRGFRIEPTEISSILSSYPGVAHSVVVCKENSLGNQNKFLVAYYRGDFVNEVTLKTFLESRLPSYAIPSAFIQMDSFPMTPSGKIDTKSLPDVELKTTETYEGPRTPLESSLLSIWASVLGVDPSRVGIWDNFFHLGGDSIISIALVSQLRNQLGFTITVKDVFLYQTVGRIHDEFSTHFNCKSVQTFRSEQGILGGSCPLLPIQKWFFGLNLQKPNHWNQAYLIQTPELDVGKLNSALVSLVERHDVLRMRFGPNGSRQWYEENVTVAPIICLDYRLFSGDGLREELTLLQTRLDIEKGPMFNVAYIIGYPEGTSRIFFAIHHLVVDLVSWRIICQEFQSIYEEKELQPKGTSYRQRAETLHQFAVNMALDERNYWERQYEFAQSYLKVFDWPISENYSIVEVRIAEEITKQLNLVGTVFNTSVNDLLLAVLVESLHQLTNVPSHSILLEGHGRDEINLEDDLSKTVGWFTTLYPIHLTMGSSNLETLVLTKESLKSVPNKGIGYGVHLGYDNSTLPGIVFNFHGHFGKKSKGVKESDWGIVIGEDVGDEIAFENRRGFIYMGALIDDTLVIDFETRLSAEFTNKLVTTFTKDLTTMIESLRQLKRSFLTPSEVNQKLTRKNLDVIQRDKEVEGIFPATSLQIGLVNHFLGRDDSDNTNFLQMQWEYRTHIDVELLKLSWEKTIKCFPALRSRFAWDEEIVLVIDKNVKLDWRYEKCLNGDELEKAILQDRTEYFDLSVSPLFRVLLFEETNDSFTCVFNCHHSICDGWSIDLIISRAHQFYLTPNDTVVVDKAFFEAQKYISEQKDNVDYWKSYLGGITDPVNLNFIAQSPGLILKVSDDKIPTVGQEFKVTLDGGIYSKLKSTCPAYGVTPSSVLQLAWHLVLHAYGLGRDTVVGVVTSGRDLPIKDIASSAGVYMSTVPVHVNHDRLSSQTLVEGMLELQVTIHAPHVGLSLAKLQTDHRIFDSIFLFQNMPGFQSESDMKRLNIALDKGYEKINYPLVIVCGEEGDSLSVVLEYEGELFQTEVIQGMIGTFEEIVFQISSTPELVTSKLEYLSAEERALSRSWNVGVQMEIPDLTLYEIFQTQVTKCPNAIAIIMKGVKTTYAQLHNQVKSLTCYLQQAHVAQGSVVCLCLDKNELVIPAMFGVWGAGCAYVPVDPTFPDERIRFITKDSRAELVLTNRIHMERFTNMGLVPTSIESCLETNSPTTKPLGIDGRSSDVAYIMYTSGTSGQPKGCLLTHRGVVNHWQFFTRYFKFEENEVIGLQCSFAFDVFLGQVTLGVLNNLPIVIIENEDILDSDRFYSICNKEKVTHLDMTPSVAGELDLSQIPSLRRIELGGEPLSYGTYNRIHISCPQLPVFNEFGPTEATITTHSYKLEPNEKVRIGVPIDNVQSYVLNEHMVQLPANAVGELYIGGVGLAAGYIQQDLTVAKFVDNPFEKGGKLYRTGDLVRLCHGGFLEYIGRIDTQVKINGMRIELEEIESLANRYVGIKQSVAKVWKNKIVLYYVGTIVEEDFWNFLKVRLACYSVPVALIELPRLPLTATGKADRNALPEPHINLTQILAPRNCTERIICEIWATALGLKSNEIGIDDNFFSLGGNSITIIKMVSKLRNVLKNRISVKDIYAQQTIRSLYENVFKNISES